MIDAAILLLEEAIGLYMMIVVAVLGAAPLDVLGRLYLLLLEGLVQVNS